VRCVCIELIPQIMFIHQLWLIFSMKMSFLGQASQPGAGVFSMAVFLM
jgi:hypothetical protein